MESAQIGGGCGWHFRKLLCDKHGREPVEGASADEALTVISGAATNNSCGKTVAVRGGANGRLITAFAAVGIL